MLIWLYASWAVDGLNSNENGISFKYTLNLLCSLHWCLSFMPIIKKIRDFLLFSYELSEKKMACCIREIYLFFNASVVIMTGYQWIQNESDKPFHLLFKPFQDDFCFWIKEFGQNFYFLTWLLYFPESFHKINKQKPYRPSNIMGNHL